jgi:two-component system copper resistance phosphate regulon response regulator CusR
VLIVEDEPRVASFLAKGLGDRGHAIRCVGTGGDAVQAVRTCPPDLVLLDIGLPDMQGWDVLRSFARQRATCAVIVLTARGEVNDRVRGLHLGADDYLAKPFAPDELLARVRSLLRRTAAPPRTSSLTAREQEVLRLLADGLNQRDIADALVISPKTVGTHIERILEKLGVHSRVQAVALAYREGAVGAVP